MCKRSSSSKLSFYDVNNSCLKIQVMADLRQSELDKAEFAKLHAYAKRGDIVGVTGFPGKTKRGELSIFPRSFTVLSPCLHMLPAAADNKVKGRINLFLSTHLIYFNIITCFVFSAEARSMVSRQPKTSSNICSQGPGIITLLTSHKTID